MQKSEKVQKCSKRLKELLPQGFTPSVGIVLGTGLGALAAAVNDAHHVSYASLPEFPQSTVISHAGHFIAGSLAGVPVILQQGRCHLYEGYSPDDVATGVRVMASLGIQSLVLTNAAGAINPQFNAGTLMLIADHINATGHSPLTGANMDAWGPRFPDMSQVYDHAHGETAARAALRLGIRLEKGVYLGTAGPQLETPAETRAYRHWGADAVGMSTIMEAIAARHMGLRTLGISCLTNKNLPDCMAPATIEEIVAMAEQAGNDLSALLVAVVGEMGS